MTKEIRLVCVVCVCVCAFHVHVPPYIQWVYMEREHYFCGLFFFPLFFCFSCTVPILPHVHVCIASATYPFYRYLGNVGL